MMENSEQEKQNAELTDDSEGNPLNGTSSSENNASFSGIKRPDPNPITEELPNNTATSEYIKQEQSTKQSCGEFENNSSAKHDISNSSVSSKESSYPSPSIPRTHQLPDAGSPVPLITLTPVTPDGSESNSTQYLHYFMTYNPDGTITAYPIHPYDPTSPSMVDQSQSQLPAFQGNQASDATASLRAYRFQDPESASQVFGGQSNVSVCQSNESLCQAVAQSNVQGSQARSQSNLPVFQESQNCAQGFQGNATVFQYTIATAFHDNRSNASGYQHVQSNSTVYQDGQSNSTVYQDGQSNSTVYQDGQSNSTVCQDCQRNATVHQDQSNSPTGQDDQKSGSVFEGHQLYDPASPQFVPYKEAKCDDNISNPSFTSWYGSHAAVESRLVAAVRVIAWENPKFIGLFSNRDKYFHRNKRTSEAKFEANIPVSEIPLPPSPTSTSLNESSLPQTSSSQVEPQSNFSISEISLPLDQAETILPEVTSPPVSIPPSSATDFKFNFSISEIPLPLDPMATESSSDAKLTKMASVATLQKSSTEDLKVNIPISEIPSPLDTPPAISSPEVEQLNTTKNFVTSIPISEIPLHFDDGSTKSLHENKLPEGTSSSTILQVNSTENYEMNFPISEIPLALDLSQKSVNGNKFSLVKLSPSVSEGWPTNQACATGYDAASTASEMTYRQESILKISKESYETENIVSEFAKKCTIDGELKKGKACGAEQLLLAGRLGLDVTNKGKQISLHKTHYKSKTENTKTSVDADKSGIHSKPPNTASNQQDKQKIPKIFQQGSNQTIDAKNALAQSKSQVENKSKIFYPSSKSSMVETEKKTQEATENETRTRSENASTSNADKQLDIRKKGISSFTQKESGRSTNSKEKISYSKSKVERKNKGNYSKLHKVKFENSLKATEKESKSALPKVDVKSDMEKIFRRGFEDAINSMEKRNLSKLKSELRNIKGTPLQSRTSVSENKTDIQSSSTSTDEKPKTDIPKIQLPEHNNPILPKETMAQSRLKADVSPKGAKASDVKVAFVKPNTKRGLEQILFSKSCVPLSGPTTLVETGMKKTTPEKSVSPGVMRALYRHRDAVQKFMEKKAGSDETLVLSMEKAEIKSMTEHKPKTAAIETESTTPKSSKTKNRRSKKTNTKDSPAENDKEPDITG